MSDCKLELTGKALQPAYQVYVIKLNYQGQEWFYVGQTGDRNYKTARSAFHRLAGHMDRQPSSTQNQIYQFVKEEIGDPEQVLPKARIVMDAYQLAPFPPPVGLDSHREMRRDAEQLESHVIQSFDRAGKRLINRNKTSPTQPCPRPDILQQVKMDFGLL